MNANSYIKENIAQVFNNCKSIHVTPEIPEKKINKAVKGFRFDGDINTIVALYDSTALGSGADGLLLTGEKVIYHEAFTDPITMLYNEIKEVKHIVDITTKKNGKEKRDEHVAIFRSESDPIKIKFVADCDHEKLTEFLKVLTTDIEEHKEEDQLKILSDLSEELKIAYLQIVVNMVFSDDGEIDEKEFAEVLQLMTRLSLTTESRNTIRTYIANNNNLKPLPSLIDTLNSECPESQRKATYISLVKDLIGIHKSVSNAPLEDFDFFNQNRQLFDVSDEEVQLAEMAIENDRKMISGAYNNTMIEKSLKELAAKSAAVGVPLGAVYLSGSVVGMSAAGLTSGLASIGFGGALGLSSMATGIGVAVILGIGAYKGIKHLTGANELEGNKRRELMLKDIIKQTQQTITDVVQDVNFLTGAINDYILKDRKTDEEIKRIMSLMSTMTKSAVRLSNKSTGTYNDTQKLRCPAVLNIDRLKNLTQAATKKAFYELAIDSYGESPRKNENGEDVIEYRLIPNLTTQQVEDLAIGFEAIGYFDTAKVAMGALGDGVDKAKDKLRGFFS